MTFKYRFNPKYRLRWHLPKRQFRIIRDNHSGYEAQVKNGFGRWHMLNSVNTFRTVEGARELIDKFRKDDEEVTLALHVNSSLQSSFAWVYNEGDKE